MIVVRVFVFNSNSLVVKLRSNTPLSRSATGYLSSLLSPLGRRVRLSHYFMRTIVMVSRTEPAATAEPVTCRKVMVIVGMTGNAQGS